MIPGIIGFLPRALASLQPQTKQSLRLCRWEIVWHPIGYLKGRIRGSILEEKVPKIPVSCSIAKFVWFFQEEGEFLLNFFILPQNFGVVSPPSFCEVLGEFPPFRLYGSAPGHQLSADNRVVTFSISPPPSFLLIWIYNN